MVSEDVIARINMTFNSMQNEFKDFLTDYKLFKSDVGDIVELRRRVNLMAGLPDESEFKQLKAKVDTCETFNNKARKLLEDYDKKIKILNTTLLSRNSNGDNKLESGFEEI